MVLLRTHVQEWVQPKPTVTNGEAWVGLDGSPDLLLECLGVALAVLDSGTVLAPDWLADASFTVEGDVECSPSCLASAEVVVDADAPTDENVGRRDAAAVIPVSTVCDVEVSGDAWAGVFLGVEVGVHVATLGDAEVELTHYSSGATPVFPFRFTMLFMDAGLLVIDAAAIPDFDGGVPLVAVCDGFSVVPELSGAVTVDAAYIIYDDFDIGAYAEIGFTGGVDQIVSGECVAETIFEGSVQSGFTGLLPTFFPFRF